MYCTNPINTVQSPSMKNPKNRFAQNAPATEESIITHNPAVAMFSAVFFFIDVLFFRRTR